ncbi:MAG: sigma-54-dependent transcriptional regulator [Planctomycetota bacterium]|jgi:DNA-binding NtrC family response regulator
MAEVLVVEDDRNAREALRKALTKDGHKVKPAGSMAEAFAAMEGDEFDLALCDVILPDGDGLDLIAKLRKAGTLVIVMSAYGTIDRAVRAMKEGAEDFLEKPIHLEKLRILIERAIGHRRLKKENVRLQQALKTRYKFDNIIGSSPVMQEVFQVVEQVAPTRATVLLLGESGTGKELFANAIHYRSNRSEGPLVKVNCAALTETLLESELFGHERGAFTGAVQRRKGRFEIAHGGTMFLDEVAEIPPPTQVKLLRVLQEQAFERVGGNETIKVDVRMITATNADLKKAVEEGRVREDLYYRLKVVTLRIPPLRERREDIPALVQHFVQKFAEQNGKADMEMDPDAMLALNTYPWPGNVRQLENVIESAVVMAPGNVITPALVAVEAPHLPQEEGSPSPFTPGLPLAAVEKQVILATLKAQGGNKAKTAKILGIGVRTLYRKLKEYGVS